jgi:hypothetical protein
MPLTREQALGALGLSAASDANGAAVQAAFERLARRYPQPHFPDRFRQLLEARDRLLAPERSWRELVESRTLDLGWILPHVAPAKVVPTPDRRSVLQGLMRAGLLSEPSDMSTLGDWNDDNDDDDAPF